MIPPAQRAEIRRLYFGEHWRIGTIAAARRVHHATVRSTIDHETGGTARKSPNGGKTPTKSLEPPVGRQRPKKPSKHRGCPASVPLCPA